MRFLEGEEEKIKKQEEGLDEWFDELDGKVYFACRYKGWF
jgi:hypothetical protein